MNIREQLDDITETRSFGLNPLHEPYNADKLVKLAANMEANGWQGAPVVVAGEQAVTGSHRIAAAMRLWNQDGVEVQIPRVEISDLCGLYGLDWDTICGEYDYDLYEAATGLKYKLPREVVDYLGFDVDGAL